MGKKYVRAERWTCATIVLTLFTYTLAQAEEIDIPTLEKQLRRQDKAEAIQERIQPVGRVHVTPFTPQPSNATPSSTNTTAPIPAPAPANANVGEKIYNTYCTSCHTTGAAGAPKLGDKIAWKSRIEAAKTTPGGMLTIVKKGANAMPPMGMCTSCSDEDLQAVIQYLLEKSQ